MKKHSDLITVILFCATVGFFAVAFVLLPDKTFSQQENRNLAQAPEINKETFFSGDFAAEVNEYYSDQFPLRNGFVKLKSGFELLTLKAENNGVLYGKNNQLAVKNFTAYRSNRSKTENTDRIYMDSVTAQVKNIEKLGEKLNIPLVTVIPPRTVDVADSAFVYDRPDGDRIFEIMSLELKSNSGFVETLSPLRERFEQGEYVYYKTDHHWTTLGAYYTYCDIMKQLGKEDKIIPKEDFQIEYINDFSGTTAAKANFPFYEKDVIEIWHYEGEDGFEIIADGEALNGFYEMSFADVSDKYSLFLDGTHNVTQITKEGGERETLLVVKDSFANCLIPFLAREYNIVALNIHTFNDISAKASEHNADGVLLICNTENLISTGDLGKLN